MLHLCTYGCLLRPLQVDRGHRKRRVRLRTATWVNFTATRYQGLSMRASTPTTSAERAILEATLGREARVRGRAPERVRELEDGERRVCVDGPTPLLIDSVLPPEHPLANTPADLRRKHVAFKYRGSA